MNRMPRHNTLTGSAHHTCLPALLLILLLAPVTGCVDPPAPRREMTVMASAYTSRACETSGDPCETAWGDRLEPGMKAIAVSPDLLKQGLVRGTRVRIAELPGEYIVLDLMPSRWSRKIDIYFGNDLQAALDWGIREVGISWETRP